MSEESFQDRINRLLSFTPTGKPTDKRFQNSVDHSLAKTTFKGRLPGFRDVPGHLYKAQFLNLEDAPITDCLVHIYEPHKVSLPVGREYTVILHSHTKEQYCPWKHMCHVRLESLNLADLPKDFQAYWKGYYESIGDIPEQQQTVQDSERSDDGGSTSKWSF